MKGKNIDRDFFDSLHKKYNPEGSKLRNYQMHLLDTLTEFDAFCRQHDIVYYMAYGTLLGAVRHQGFIPWDDDADLWMDRENYMKLEKLMQYEYHALTDKVSVSLSIRPQLWAPPYAYIDIFLLDNTPTCKLLSFIKENMALFMYAMVKCRGRIDNHSLGKFKPYFIFLPIAYLFNMQKWLKLYTKVQMWFPKRGKQVQSFNECGIGIKRKYPADNEIWTPIELEFEGHNFYAPKGWDTLLKIRYGDYMTIPQENERLVHGSSIMVGSERIDIV